MSATERPDDEADAEEVRAAVTRALGDDPHEEVAEASTEDVPDLIEGTPFHVRHFLGPLGQ